MKNNRGIVSPDDKNSQSSESLQNSIETKEVIKAYSKRVLRVHEINEPIIGRYTSKEQAQYSPIFGIEQEGGEIIKVMGNKDLTTKMQQLKIGDKISISYGGSIPTSNGYTMHLVVVERYQQKPLSSMPQVQNDFLRSETSHDTNQNTSEYLDNILEQFKIK